MKVLVTPRSMLPGTPAVQRLVAAGLDVVHGPEGRQPTPEELVEILPGCQGWIAGVEQVPAAVIDAAESLRVISRNGAGADAIDHVAAAAAGVTIRTTPGANAQGVAELTVLLALAALRHLVPSSTALKDGGWVRPKGLELSERTVGLVGFGAIGRRVASILHGFGTTVVATDPAMDGASSDGIEVLSLPQLLGTSDVVSLHLPAIPGGPVIGAQELDQMVLGAVLINTSRAQLVDRAAVLDALESGRLAAYAVDAFEVEPPPVDDLLRHPNVIATPHIGAATVESASRAADVAVENLLEELGIF
ncbi:NAD(P)-dependent oxidoreductase [Euzebya sp.]|uniref:NAD(P)-dependent oxidoreductase n=1 Tax=Euzebya sp. TaxID=1971409 RepID=UPI0035176AE1